MVWGAVTAGGLGFQPVAVNPGRRPLIEAAVADFNAILPRKAPRLV